MFPNNSNNSSSNVIGNSRRAFRDVTNAERNVDGRAGIKPTEKRITHVIPTVRRSETEVIPSAAAPSFARQSSLVSSKRSFVTNASSYQHTGQVDDIDERDADDPLCATAFVQDMYEYFSVKEISTSVRPTYMDAQPHINERMRSILVDWLVEVHLKFKLVPETLYLCVNIIDRFLSLQEISRPKLQLLGVTALLVAAKYEEIYPPELRDLVYICDRAYNRNEIIEMEETLLKTLSYRITVPSAHAFLVRFLKAAHADKKIVQLSCYILDGTLQSFPLLQYLPSQLAAASVFLARRAVGRNSWSPTLLKFAGYCEEDVAPVASAILVAKNSAASNELRAVTKKYSSSRYGGVASVSLSASLEL